MQHGSTKLQIQLRDDSQSGSPTNCIARRRYDLLTCVLWQAVLLEAIEDAGFEGELLQEADSNCLTLQIEGMTCSSCSSAVESALRSQKGVVSAAVNLLAGRAEVRSLPV